MGGVPLLLMAIAMGITFGWQPDGRGGVDYIIQVPPDQVDAVLRSGEISSVIDPAVRGHVSRVIIKVGNDPLPRDTPTQLSGTKRVGSEIVQASDQTPISIPEITQSRPANVVMKPQTGGSGAGMALPDSLTDAQAGAAGSGFRDGMADLARRESERVQQQRMEQARAAAAANARGNNPSPGANAQAAIGQTTNANAGANASALPPFTGGDQNSAMARVRTGVPTTEPATTRDRQWFSKSDVRTPTTDPIDSKAPWPGLVGPPDPRKTAATAGNFGNLQPLGSTSNFARVPGGLSTPTAAGQPGTSAEMTAYQQAEYLRQLELQRQAQNAGRVAQTPASGYSGAGDFTAVRNPNGVTGADSSLSFPNLGGGSTRGQQYDSRLTAAQIAGLPPGAWSRDEFGNAIDPVGRILDETGRMVSQQRAYELRQPRSNTPAATERPFVNSPINRDFQYQQELARTGFDDRIANRDSFSGSGQFAGGQPTGPRGNDQTNSGLPTRGNDNSPSDRGLTGVGERGDQIVSNDGKRRATLAAQPLFNGLLLMSIVANVYLIVWLKNLRYQFSDLVASKRAASSDIAI